MPEAKRCHPALPAVVFFLLFASAPSPTPGVEGSSATRSRPRDFQTPAGDKQTLLELLLKEVFPRDSNLKEKFLIHLTGPVTFSAECSKHFHRLYHNTRDCSTPAYYKRCARLLMRLAVSPLCTQP